MRNLVQFAEVDTLGGALARRYIHGTSYVDERAILLEGDGANNTLDTYYYLLRELYAVAGLMAKNGALVEAYEYDMYGKVQIWGYPQFDFDRDGDVYIGTKNQPDRLEFNAAYGVGVPTDDPSGDYDAGVMDGRCDNADQTYRDANTTGDGDPPTKLHVSAVGNQYFFTGRRLQFYEDLTQGTNITTNRHVQYNRNRHFDPRHGKWLQRDPAEYVDGMNLYEYVTSGPTRLSDPFGRVATLNSSMDALRNFVTGLGEPAELSFRLVSVVKSMISIRTF